jgi:hypothetical protein
VTDPLEHAIKLDLASGAHLTILYFSDREMRWIFKHHYIGNKKPGARPDIANDVQLVANYTDGILAPTLVLSMHVVVPSRLGQQFFVGVDISPGANTYLEFTYGRTPPVTGTAYRLAEISKGARERVCLDNLEPALVKPINFPFPIPNQLAVIFGRVSFPFLGNDGVIDHFDLPTSTLRHEPDVEKEAME